jgi:hypothetical protein
MLEQNYMCLLDKVSYTWICGLRSSVIICRWCIGKKKLKSTGILYCLVFGFINMFSL